MGNTKVVMNRRKTFVHSKLGKVLGQTLMLHQDVINRAHERDFTWRRWSKKENAFHNFLKARLTKIEDQLVEIKGLRCL